MVLTSSTLYLPFVDVWSQADHSNECISSRVAKCKSFFYGLGSIIFESFRDRVLPINLYKFSTFEKQ